MITPQEAQLAASIPMAEDLTAEADSGGHTDNRPAISLLPTMLALRDELGPEIVIFIAAHILESGARNLDQPHPIGRDIEPVAEFKKIARLAVSAFYGFDGHFRFIEVEYPVVRAQVNPVFVAGNREDCGVDTHTGANGGKTGIQVHA